MKILLINKFLYPKGGDAIMTLNTGALLRSKGHEVHYWGMASAKNGPFNNNDLFVDEADLNAGGGIKTQWRIAANMIYSVEAKRKLEALLDRTGNPDLVHLHNFAHQISPSILTVIRKRKIPCVMTMHDYKLVCASYTLLAHQKICERCLGGAYWNCFAQSCVKSSKAKSLLNTVEMYVHHKVLHIYDGIDLFISPSRFLQDKVMEMGFMGLIKTLPNFVAVPKEKIPEFTRDLTVGYVGRLSSEKGILTLIAAMKTLPKVRLKIMGDGPLRQELQGFVRSQKILNVRFLGHLGEDQLNREIASCCLTVCPSECYENNPRSVIESFALGRPVIGARIGGIPELVKDHVTGLTFEPGNAPQLSECISVLATDQPRCLVLGKNARKLVEDELNDEVHYTRLMDIYRKAADINKRRYLNS